MLRALWIAGAVAWVACGGKSPPPAPAPPAPVAATVDAGLVPVVDAAPLDQDLPRLVERSLAMYGDVARALAASDDCKVVIGKLGELATAYRDVVIANAKVLHDGRAKELRAALDPHNDEFDRSAKAIFQSPTMAKCSADRAFARALDDLFESPP